MKKIILLFAILCYSQFTNAQQAQKNQNIYFFKNNGKEVDTKDSADYARIIQEPDSGETNFMLLEFYADGKRKTVGKVSAFEPFLVYEGAIMKFDKDGKRKEITTYEKNMPLGMSFEYHTNGKLHKQTEYLPYTLIAISPINVLLSSSKPFNPNSKLVYFADSTGKALVEEGNGHFIESVKTKLGERIEEGDYKDGLKHGLWKGNETESGTSFIESYELGKLVKGESTKEGIKFQYIAEMTAPSFKGGIQKFYEYVGYSVRYPADAAKERIDGTVTVGFTVEKDGGVAEVEVKKSVYPSLDDEAKRVVKASPKWIPATQRGVPVRVKYAIPLKFSMPR